MMVKKNVHDEIQGFDERFVEHYSDVDYCLRAGELGKEIVMHAFAELYHYEPRFKNKEDKEEQQERFQKETELFKTRWKAVLEKEDPYYNPNLALNRKDCSLRW